MISNAFYATLGILALLSLLFRLVVHFLPKETRKKLVPRKTFRNVVWQGRIDKDRSVWLGRWREDEIHDGQVRRVRRRQVLGTLRQLPTEKLALRELSDCLERAAVNRSDYRPLHAATFSQVADRWVKTVLVQFKPSTQINFRCHMEKHLRPFFGATPVKEISAETVQRFVAGLDASPKTARNILATFRVVWNSAKAWSYVDRDPFGGVRLRRSRKPRQFSFTLDEVRRILATAEEPYKTFYWLAAETGMRAGKLCGLRVDDLDFDGGIVHVNSSAWRGQLLDPKTATGVRSFALSPQLVAHLRLYLQTWRPNANGLLFATRTGTPWDANLLVKRKLQPLLAQLKIPRCGLHAFRHANASLMDRFQVPMKVRQQRLGHSDPKITLGTYTHVAGEDDARIATQLGEILDPILDPNAENKETGVSLQANSGLIN
jgi:integrase